MAKKLSYRRDLKLTIQDMPKSREQDVVADFTVRVTSAKDTLIEERFKVFLNEKPASMSNKNWEKLLSKVLRVEFYNRFAGGKGTKNANS